MLFYIHLYTLLLSPITLGFPGGSDGKESACNTGDSGSVPRQLTPVVLPGKSHGQRSLVGYSPWGHRESDMTEQLST